MWVFVLRMSLTSPLYPISLQLDDRTFTEYRISVYACKPTDWHKTSTWICENNLEAYGNNKWLVQLPRIYRVFKKIGRVECFQDTLDNFFRYRRLRVRSIGCAALHLHTLTWTRAKARRG